MGAQTTIEDAWCDSRGGSGGAAAADHDEKEKGGNSDERKLGPRDAIQVLDRIPDGDRRFGCCNLKRTHDFFLVKLK